jgi:CRP-like cAMP-binding protein
MYILESGNCEVLVKGPISNRETFVRELVPGDVFGETGLLYGKLRTASVKCKDATTVGALS